MLVNDCEQYKHFLQAPRPDFCGERAARFSHHWRPFSTQPLSPPSQKQAVLILRAAFDWLVRVRYLGGNPWVAVKDPSVVAEIHAMNIERALSDSLWGRVAQSLDRLCAGDDSKQDRAARAVIFLLGDSGLRRAEAAAARRGDLKPGRWADVWVLRVIGKRNKQRDVPVSPRTVDALRTHWQDRGLDFDRHENQPLITPVTLPQTATALKRHGDGGAASSNGYSTEGLYRLVLAALKRIRAELEHEDNGDSGSQAWSDMAQLGQTTPHAFRHTFGTLAVADGMPLDVAQGILGHASAATTAIYVRAKEKRSQEAAEKYYAAKPLSSKKDD
jgi:integrase